MREISGKTQVVAVALVTALCMLGDSMLYVVLPLYWQEAGLGSLWEVGVLLSINRFVRVPLGPLVGKWYERTGGRAGLVLAVVLAFVTTLSYGFQGFWLWLLMRSLWGVAWTFLRLGAYSLIVAVADEHNRGQLMGLYNGLYRLGSLGGMLVGALFASWYGLLPASLLLACCSLFALLLVFLYIRPGFTNRTAAAVEKGGESHRLRLWRQAAMQKTMLTALLVTMIYQGMFASTLSRLVEQRTPFLALGGIVLGAAVLASLVQGLRWCWEPWAAPVVGRLADRYGRRKMFAATLFAGALLFALIQAGVPLGAWFAVLLGIQLTATIITTVMDTLAADEAARHANSTAVMTFYSVITDLGAALGPLFAFWLDEHAGLSVMYVGLAAALLLIAAAWSVRQRRESLESAP
ncbi:MFS transporter [Brevibacillus agri]|uniref:MFS transporter n=1 Tax=Brevibacillus agri TaxID=51101 RepID=UPI0018CDDE51|nr:MFS transporter [Brevibacillus agri]MBG9566472.1 arabinose ABC transporter permease [Brevibacillus agri]MCG5254231.1 MFS transporter [Brevibacillus agri]